MNFEDKMKYSIVILIISLLVIMLGLLFMPKPHLGYYLKTVDGSVGTHVYPVYRIYNNWDFCYDTMAFETLDKEECLRIFERLKGIKP